MYTVAAYYRFLAVADPAALREEMLARFGATDLLGTTLIATEGVNGTMAGSVETINILLEFLHERVGLERGEVKFSTADLPTFRRLKIKVKKEIIPFRGVPIDPTRPGQ